MKPITIIGAGLAGLALGNALQREGVPVTLYEAGTLPRHRVCGEFICGRGTKALEQLGLSTALEGCALHKSTAWHIRQRAVLHKDLPYQAAGISRHLIDQRLAESFQALGGQLAMNQRIQGTELDEGRAYCNGRQLAKSSDWIGLKLHCTELQTTADLELHLGKNVYVGLSGIENGRVNVCALVKRNPALKALREDWLVTYLNASGLNDVAERIANGGIDPKSHSGVAGIEFSSIPKSKAATLRLGDAYSVIPPFTGNGMSIALESAEIAFPFILKYALGQLEWNSAKNSIDKRFHQHFDNRLRAARILHPWLSHPLGQRALASLSRTHLLPFNLFYRLTH